MMNKMKTILLNADDPAGGGEPKEPVEPKQPEIKYYEAEDPVTKLKVKVPEELREYVGHVVSFNRKIAKQDSQSEVEELTKKITELESTLEDQKSIIESKSQGESEQIENIKALHKKQIDGLTAKLEQSSQKEGHYKSLFDSAKIDSAIHGAVSNYQVYNQKQVADLIKEYGKAQNKEVIDPGTGNGSGQYEVKLTWETMDEAGNRKSVELSPQEAVDKFLSSNENAHHLRSKLSPGGGSVTATSSGKKTMKRPDFLALDPKEQMEVRKSDIEIVDN